jgi:uncharacterized protein YbjT (DUF2867 family)
MAEKKLIAIVGATGSQGGGLVRSILAHPGGPFAARVLTRQPTSEKARELERRGAEIVAADLDDEASLRRAFEGAHGAFCVTSFWEHFSPEKELAQAAAMARAARHGGVKHVVWSTLEDTRQRVPLDDARMPTLMGRYKVPHFDAKGEANRLFTEAGVPTTFLLTSFYWDNLIHFGMGLKPGADGALTFPLPMGEKKLPGIAADDIGPCAHGLFKQRPTVLGKTVGVAGEHLTGAQMAASLGRALGKPVRYSAVPHAAYRELGFPGADDLGNMFQYKHDFEEEFCAARNPDVARSLHPGLRTFDAWLASNAGRIPVS